METATQTPGTAKSAKYVLILWTADGGQVARLPMWTKAAAAKMARREFAKAQTAALPVASASLWTAGEVDFVKEYAP